MVTSIIFPAFVFEYTGTEGKSISPFRNNFIDLVEKASGILGVDLKGFDFNTNNFLNDELRSQYISYLFSCCVADILRAENVKPSFVSGYSMGIYAALYYCRSIGFEDGLMMVKNAWDIISGVTEEGSYGMGMIIGLDRSELLNLILTAGEVEICNQNNKHTFIISGSSDSVEDVLISARNEGALRANVIPVSKPYHSRFLGNTGPEFAGFVKTLTFRTSDFKYISSLDQKIIETTDRLREEVINNLSSEMNWKETMSLMVTLGTDVFFECGAGDGLTRNARFIDGDFRSFSVARLDRFLNAVSE